MPVKTHPIQSSFSRGEWSPDLEGRVDIEGYKDSAHEITNWIIKVKGGLITRPGWHFVAETKDSTKESRLIPFQYSELQNYIFEIGDEYLRFFMDCGQVESGGVPYEIEFPYQDTDIWEIRFGQDDVDLYLVHPDYSPSKLLRYSNTDFELVEENRDNGPFMDETTAAAITPSATTGSITLTAVPSLGSNIVLNSTFVGVTSWIWGAGWTSPSGLYARHTSDGTAPLEQDVGAAAGVVYRVVFTLSYYSAGNVTAKIGGVNGTTRSANGTYTEDITTTGTGNLQFVPSNTFRGIIDNVYVYEVNSTIDVFLAGHIGSVFRIKIGAVYGRVRIDTVTDGLHATGTVLETLGGLGASAAYQESCWSEVNGYPRIINFHEGRIQYASTYEQPQTLWASKTHYGNDFAPGTDANSPYALTLSTQRIIRWVKTARLLCIGCMSGEITAIGPSDAAISVIDPPRIKDETNHGSAPIDSIKINKAIIFLQQAEKKLREFSYNYENDAYSAPDITILADHMFQEGIMDYVYQQEPYSILWVLTADGILHGCTYNRETNTVGWYDVETDGEVESIAVIPYQGADQLWAIIKRNINGTDKRFVEYMDCDINLDCALTYSGVPITTVSGLDHLIGETVKVIADGGYEGEFVVSPAGSIELENAAPEIVAGLSFTPRLVTSRPEIPLKDGTSQGKFKSWVEIWLRLINSMGLTVNGEVIPARTTDDLLGVAPDPYSGDFRVENRKWDRDGRITIEQTLPMSAEIVCLFGTLILGDD